MFDVQPQSPVLQEIVESLRRRGRSLKYSGGLLRVERVIETSPEGDRERLEVLYRASRRPRAPMVRVHAWSDRWVWVDAREQGNEGWKWSCEAQGRFARQPVGKELVRALEGTIRIVGAAAEREANFRQIWLPLLAAGPRGLPE